MNLTRHCGKLAVISALALGLPVHAWAQETRITPAPPAPVQARAVQGTLAQALAGVRPPQSGVALCVGAEAVTLPTDLGTPPAGTDWMQAATASGRLVRTFGSVAAVAPPTMTVLNSSPGAPNIYDGMPQGDALKLLVARLSPGQWQALTGEQGLGLSDLADQDQRDLFAALFPGGTLKVAAEGASAKDARDIGGDLPQVRLRLGRRVEMTLGVPMDPAQIQAGGLHIVSTMGGDRPGGPKPYRIVAAPGYAKDTLYGARVRAELPNALKKSQLDYAAAVLQESVPLAGLRTVGDLVARIGQVTHVELYADPHYAKKTLTLLGPAPAVPAADLLRALSLCLAATWRQVGPAFVLTDDTIGVGTRRQVWADFAAEAEYRRQEPLGQAGDQLRAAHSPDQLPTFGDPLALSDKQLAPDPKAPGANPFAAGLAMASGITGMRIAMAAPDQLTPEQKAMARQLVDEANKKAQADPKAQPVPESVLHGPAILMAVPHLELLDPALDAPVDMGLQAAAGLFTPSTPRLMAQIKGFQEQQKKAPAVPKTPVPPLKMVLAPVSRRAVLARPATAADMDALVAAMRAVGLNQLWLLVNPLTPGPSPSGGEGGDLLAEALKETRGTGIAVFAALDLLAWGPDAPPALCDLTVTGETSVQAAAHRSQFSALQDMVGDIAPELRRATPLYVSPFAPEVQQALAARVADLARSPGLAGLVWRETAPPGYGDTSLPFGGDHPLGYTLPARLAFLRQSHADPVDIAPAASPGRADTRLPEFDDAAVSAGLSAKWDGFRARADAQFLRALRAAVPPAPAETKPLRLLIQQRGLSLGGDWYGAWDSPQAPLPAARNPFEAGSAGLAGLDAAAQAKAQTRTAILSVTPATPLTSSALAARLQAALKGKSWDGFVLDLTAAKEANPLAPLAAAGEQASSDGG